MFKVLIDLSATTDFPLLCIEYISISLSFNHFLKELLQNSLHFSNHILFGFLAESTIPFYQQNQFIFQRKNPSIFIRTINNTQ